MQASFGRSPGMGAATPRQPRRSVKDQVSSYASSSDADSSEPLPPLLARAAESDPALTRLDLCFNKQFVVLSGPQKLQALEQLARGSALESVRLDGLGLDNTHGATLARLLRHDEHDGSGGVRTLSLQSNALGEPALLALAQAVSGHPSLSELAVARTTRTRLANRCQGKPAAHTRARSPWAGGQPAGRALDARGGDAARRDGDGAQAHQAQARAGAGRGAAAATPAAHYGGGRARAQGARGQPCAWAAAAAGGLTRAPALDRAPAARGGGGEQVT